MRSDVSVLNLCGVRAEVLLSQRKLKWESTGKEKVFGWIATQRKFFVAFLSVSLSISAYDIQKTQNRFIPFHDTWWSKAPLKIFS